MTQSLADFDPRHLNMVYMTILLSSSPFVMAETPQRV